MSTTAPNIDSSVPQTWQGQLTTLLKRYLDFPTRDDALGHLSRMAKVAELYVADHPADDGAHTNLQELLRTSLQAHLAGDDRAFTKLLHIAVLADKA